LLDELSELLSERSLTKLVIVLDEDKGGGDLFLEGMGGLVLMVGLFLDGFGLVGFFWDEERTGTSGSDSESERMRSTYVATACLPEIAGVKDG
jgi:hypothetical protein